MPESVIHPDTESLRKFVLGELSEDDSALIERHIVDCDSCCEQLAEVDDDQFIGLIRDRGTTQHSAAWETDGLNIRASDEQLDGLATFSEEEFGQESSVGNTTDRYELRAEIARGGMGAVYHAFDLQLRREVAIKVVLPGGRSDVRLRRFVKEAQITGQLQHPGVPPVYELGRLPDMRPFIAMKYVEGDTLRTLLDRRIRPSTDLPRLLDVFEQICQTVGFAHKKRQIVHRDLKPNNIMVGKHGETQVMDWGIAKVLGTEVGHTDLDEFECSDNLGIGSDWSNVASAVTRVGSVLGTPAYMPPEQARGDISEVDERMDVFALGAILCEILTGKPPYDEPLIQHVLVMAQNANQEAARDRLAECDADRELVAMTLRCLSPQKEDRPRNAGEVAEAVTDYLRSTQQRLRQAEVERAQSAVRIAEERKRRRIQMVLAAVLSTILMVVGGAWYANSSRTGQAATKVKDELANAEIHANSAEAHPLAPGRHWDNAHGAIQLAYGVANVDGNGNDQLLRQIHEVDAAIALRKTRSDQDLALYDELPAVLGDFSKKLNKLREDAPRQPSGVDSRLDDNRNDRLDRDPAGRPGRRPPPRPNGLGGPPPRFDDRQDRGGRFEERDRIDDRENRPGRPGPGRPGPGNRHPNGERPRDDRSDNDRDSNHAGGKRMDEFRMAIAKQVFDDYGFPVSENNIDEFARHIVSRPAKIRNRVVAALDVWHLLESQQGKPMNANWIARVLDRYEILAAEKILATRNSLATKSAKDSQEQQRQRKLEELQDLHKQYMQQATRHPEIRLAIQTENDLVLRAQVKKLTADQSLLANERTSVLWCIGRTLSRRLGRLDPENKTEALKLLRVAQSYHLADYLLNKELGELLRESGDGDDSSSYFHFMLAAVSREGTGKDRRLYRQMASWLQAQKKYGEAIAIFHDLQAEFPNDAGAPLEIGKLHMLLGEPAKARAAWESAKPDQHSRKEEIYRLIAGSYESEANFIKAIEYFDLANEDADDDGSKSRCERLSKLVAEFQANRSDIMKSKRFKDQIDLASRYFLVIDEYDSAIELFDLACSSRDAHDHRLVAASSCIGCLPDSLADEARKKLLETAQKWFEFELDVIESDPQETNRLRDWVSNEQIEKTRSPQSLLSLSPTEERLFENVWQRVRQLEDRIKQ
jgi:serine/threonine protein kinase